MRDRARLIFSASLTQRRSKLLWRFARLRSSGLLNHGHKKKIKRSEKNSTRGDKIKIEVAWARGSSQKEKENASLRLLLR
jgi:hypothetical protein